MARKKAKKKKGGKGKGKRPVKSPGTPCEDAAVPQEKLPRKVYEKELERLQVELCMLQRWVRETGQRIIVIFEGRDAAGKGGAIKRITERVSPRVFRTVALPAPTEREKTQLYLQRYIAHLPAAGEVVLFDRSWYNRAGVERVMGFCTKAETQAFLESIPFFEKGLVEQGILLVKLFFDVSRDEQTKRFKRRYDDPLRQWKLSPMDLESWARWWDYTAAFEEMFRWTDSAWAPWYVVPSNDKRRARLNVIAHLLDIIPYETIPYDAPDIPRRRPRKKGQPERVAYKTIVPNRY